MLPFAHGIIGVFCVKIVLTLIFNVFNLSHSSYLYSYAFCARSHIIHMNNVRPCHFFMGI